MTRTPCFISSRLSFKGRVAALSATAGFAVIIAALSISAGFRSEIGSALAETSGDISILPYKFRLENDNRPIRIEEETVGKILSVKGVSKVSGVIMKAGITRGGKDIQGVLFKGVGAARSADSTGQMSAADLDARIPRRLASILKIGVGDDMVSHFIGESVITRKFTVKELYDPLVTSDDRMTVFCPIAVLRRINGWQGSEVGALEVTVEEKFRDRTRLARISDEISGLLYEDAFHETAPAVCLTARDSWPQLFDWLDIVASNVYFIIAAMIVVAVLNMVVSLLILLFENISTIGLLGGLGMNRRELSLTFLLTCWRTIGKGMLAGNAIGISLCLIQKQTRLLTLDPENYFIQFVPIDIPFGVILLCNLGAAVIFTAAILLTCRFIGSVHPAETLSCE